MLKVTQLASSRTETQTQAVCLQSPSSWPLNQELTLTFAPPSLPPPPPAATPSGPYSCTESHLLWWSRSVRRRWSPPEGWLWSSWSWWEWRWNFVSNQSELYNPGDASSGLYLDDWRIFKPSASQYRPFTIYFRELKITSDICKELHFSKQFKFIQQHLLNSPWPGSHRMSELLFKKRCEGGYYYCHSTDETEAPQTTRSPKFTQQKLTQDICLLHYRAFHCLQQCLEGYSCF